ncbi:hypothetical protein PAHAL_1G102400 [Panicum hallii]|jgi:hypothetical protein|uniref:Uncharacterized protein n=1 Tax=Panicum hallii TaxID=206008 RepID=A0A2S3GMU4_9POAL|nr:hypothetical protein PAHAL_1G102400 [Panicum hallii]
MAGRFPDDLPPLDGLVSVNISHNNFSGTVPAAAVRRFGQSAFFQAGNALQVIEDGAPSGGKKRNRAVVIALISAGAAVTRPRWRSSPGSKHTLHKL